MGPQEDIWQVYVDGASSCRGIILIPPEGIKVEKSFKLGFLVSNNETKYEALLAELRMSRQVGADKVKLYCDSWLVVSQITSKFKAKD